MSFLSIDGMPLLYFKLIHKVWACLGQIHDPIESSLLWNARSKEQELDFIERIPSEVLSKEKEQQQQLINRSEILTPIDKENSYTRQIHQSYFISLIIKLTFDHHLIPSTKSRPLYMRYLVNWIKLQKAQHSRMNDFDIVAGYMYAKY